MMAEGAQRILIAGGIEIEIMVARDEQPGYLQAHRRAQDLRVQRQVVVGDVAQGQAQRGAVPADQWLHDVAPVVVHVLHRRRLAVGEQYVECAVLRRSPWTQPEVRAVGLALGDAAVLQRGPGVVLQVAPADRQAVRARRQIVARRLDDEERAAVDNRGCTRPARSSPQSRCRWTP